MSIKKGKIIVAGAPLEPRWGSFEGNIKDQADLQNELAIKAPVNSPSFTGIPTAPNAASGTSNNQIATTEYVQRSIGEIGSALPPMEGHNGEFLSTNGTIASWEKVDAFPEQTGHNGQFLTTNGTTVSWATVQQTLSGLTDTTITNPANKNILYYNGSKWVNDTTTSVIGYTPADDSLVVHIGGAETITGNKTFTGNILQIQNDSSTTFCIQDPEADYTTIPSAQRSRSIDCVDKNGKILGNFQFIRQANGAQETQLMARNKANGTQVSAYLRLGVNASGGQFAIAPTPTEDTTSSTQIDTVGARNTKLQSYAPLSSPALTDIPTAPTASAGTNTTQIATTAFVTTAIANYNPFPSQSGKSGKFLQTNGTSVLWQDVPKPTITYWEDDV